MNIKNMILYKCIKKTTFFHFFHTGVKIEETEAKKIFERLPILSAVWEGVNNFVRKTDLILKLFTRILRGYFKSRSSK